MKICYFADSDSIHTKRWCEHFSHLGHEIHVISFKENPIKNTVHHYIDAGPINVSGKNWKTLLSFRKVKSILKEIKPDIFHAHYATSYGITGALCNYKPYIISTWGSDVLSSPNQSKAIRILLQFALKRANWITVVADHMVQSLINLGVDPAKVSTITHGIDPAIFHNTNQTKSTDKFSITSTRSFEEVYNIPHLIKSFAAASNTQPNLHLNLIGSGSLLEQIEKLVEELGIRDKVTYFGRLTQSEMAEVLNLSHVFVTVSKSDGDVVSLAEGMACNNFCITSDIPANRFWIEENKNGYFVAIDDVDALTNKILLAHTNYQELMKTATPTNEAILLSKGIWGNNMKKVEAMYLKLTQQ